MFTEKFTSLVLAIAASGTMLALSAGPAHAQAIEVSASAQKVATVAGRAQVDSRLVRAAERVCGANELRPLSDYHAKQACVAHTLSKARTQLAQTASAIQVASR